MTKEEVFVFLGNVPLLRRLPGSSVQKISELAEVVGSVSADEENHPEFHLKRYDYFSFGLPNDVHQADVVDIFRGITPPDVPKFGKVFGGQIVGQALAAASKSVDCLKVVYSLHAYFLLVGDFNIPIIYQVYRLRDGKNFARRKVDAIQKGNVIFTLLASFQFYHISPSSGQGILLKIPEHI
ncbi:acyl-coenzyme A thioesterase 8-like [Glycine max]|uniref:acyl-coenzyme A thioesterase 8-like n=1 Tax=Glycine max TaxID=3847 RepID=UPI001B355B6C|nr:acyl-coenzyme A thioesterase 8-like [Glycine max]